MPKRVSLFFSVCSLLSFAASLALAGFLGVSLAAQTPKPPGSAPAKPAFFPLGELKPGMKGVGRTVFSGSKIEEFQVEILGVLENIGPRQSVILARLSGGPLEQTGVMAGMSGSPVYIDGKLVGAIALSFPFSKEPIAGITPIEQMSAALESQPLSRPGMIPVDGGSQSDALWFGGSIASRLLEAATRPVSLLPAMADEGVTLAPGRPRMMRIAAPLVMSGFTARTLEQFAPQFRALGLEPMQGGGGGSSSANSVMGDGSSIQPGSMISVQLIRGDLGVNADGTVTYREGDRIYAFGHRFLAAGPIDLPFAASNVITLLPNTSSSFKISTPGKLLGSIRQDRDSGVMGVIGENPRMIPVTVSMKSDRSADVQYHFEVARDRFLSPLLMQITVFGAIDATERALGESSLGVRGTIALKGLPPVNIENMFSSEASAPALASQVAAVPLALLLQSGLPGIEVQAVNLEINSSDRRRISTLDQVWSSKHEVKPGEKIEVSAVLRAENGSETMKKAEIEIPASLAPGPLQITVADGNSLNLSEVREMPGNFTPKDAAQLVRAINNLRRNNRLYVRLWRPGTSFLLHGVQFPSPPPSLAQAMANESSVSTNIATTAVTILGESALDPLPAMVTGQKTITVNVKSQ